MRYFILAQYAATVKGLQKNKYAQSILTCSWPYILWRCTAGDHFPLQLYSNHIMFFTSLHQTFLFAAHPDALCETEYCGGPLPWVHTDIYEANVSLSWSVPRLGGGRFSFCQRDFGIELWRHPDGEEYQRLKESFCTILNDLFRD